MRRFYTLLTLLVAFAGAVFAAGALSGNFSVSPSSTVKFSQGNLQYCASTRTWRFASNQYDCVGTSNNSISSTYSGYIDLFGWGTSGYNGKYPYMTSVVATDYGSGSNNISGTNYDWGQYNTISNGGGNSWRTLTSSEWQYLTSSRANASSKIALATVNGVKGLVLLPDTWTLPTGCSFTATKSSYSTNTYTSSQWSSMQSAGAVFLPASGYRYSSGAYSFTTYVGTMGYYWTSTASGSSYAYMFNFGSGYAYTDGSSIQRFNGYAVRLVTGGSGSSSGGGGTSSQTYTISVSSSDLSKGTVSGGGTYKSGSYTTIVATPKEGYEFDRWSDGNTNASYYIKVESNASYIAYFRLRKAAVRTSEKNILFGNAYINGDESKNLIYAEQGSTLMLYAKPNPGFKFVKWTDGNTDNPRSIIVPYTSETGKSDYYYYAEFEGSKNFKLTVSSNNSKYGTTTGSGTYLAGTMVEVTANPTDEGEFLYWSDDANNINKERDFYLLEDMTLTAIFQAKRTYLLNLEVESPAFGKVTGAGSYNLYDYVKISAIPNDGYKFVQWSDGSTSRTRSIRIEGNTSLTAIFEACENLDQGELNCNGITWVLTCSGELRVNAPNGFLSCSYELPWRQYASLIESVKIGYAVKYIGDDMFSNLSNLKEVKFATPNQVISIGERAFENCSSLKSIDIPKVSTIGKSAFSRCDSLTTINIPAVTEVGAKAFSNCISLDSLDLPNVNTIGEYAFENCTSLTNINLGENIKKLDYHLFEGCTSLKSITLPASVQEFTRSTFSGCENLTHLQYNIVNYKGEFEDYHQNMPSSLTHITVGDNVKSIPKGLFGYLKNLKRVKLPNSLETINYYAFSRSEIDSINIPVNVKNVDYAFPSSKINTLIWEVKTIKDKTSNNHYLDASVDTLVITKTVEHIPSYLIRNVKKIIIEEGVVSVGPNAFYNSTVESANIPSTLSNIDYMFNYCSSLKEIEFPDNLEVIGEGAFAGCMSLPSLELPNSVTTIGKSAFSGCSSLSTIEIPSSVTTIGDNAFYTKAKKIIIGENVKSIGEAAFYTDENTVTYWNATNCNTVGGTKPLYLYGKLVIGENVVYIPGSSPDNFKALNFSYLETVTSNALVPPVVGDGNCYYDSDTELYVPCESKYLYQVADFWEKYYRSSSSNLKCIVNITDLSVPEFRTICEGESDSIEVTYLTDREYYGRRSYTITDDNEGVFSIDNTRVGAFRVIFSPKTEGIYTATLNICLYEMQTNISVQITATCTNPAINDLYVPDFGKVFVGETKEVQATYSLAGNYGYSFMLEGDNVFSCVSHGEGYVTIAFSPLESGVYNGKLTIETLNVSESISFSATALDLGTNPEPGPGDDPSDGNDTPVLPDPLPSYPVRGYMYVVNTPDTHLERMVKYKPISIDTIDYFLAPEKIETKIYGYDIYKFEVRDKEMIDLWEYPNAQYTDWHIDVNVDLSTTPYLANGVWYSSIDEMMTWYVRYIPQWDDEASEVMIEESPGVYVATFDAFAESDDNDKYYYYLGNVEDPILEVGVTENGTILNYLQIPQGFKAMIYLDDTNWETEWKTYYKLVPPGKDWNRDCIDLGLTSGLCWATKNLGATEPQQEGTHFAWGEVEPKEDYSYNTYKWANQLKNKEYIKYVTDDWYGLIDFRTILEPTDDAANVTLEDKWHMPTQADVEELLRECTTEFGSYYGVNGYFVTGPNGNAIFLPVVGVKEGIDYEENTRGGDYWTSSLYENNQAYAVTLSFSPAYIDTDDMRRTNGLAIRPVIHKDYVGIEEVVAINVYAKDHTIYCEEPFQIYTVTGLEVTHLNGALEGVYIVKTEKGNQLISVW